MWEPVYFVLLALLLLPAPFLVRQFFALLTGLAAKVERMDVLEFAPLPEGAEPPALTPYHLEVNRQAEELGFIPQGLMRHVKHPVHASLWLSPDQLSVLRVGSGKIAGMGYSLTTLVSQLEDGAYVSTRDQGGVTDLTGLTRMEILHNADLYELYPRHVAHLADSPSEPLLIQEGQALSTLEARDRTLADRLVELRLGEYVDPQKAKYRYTWRGAYRIGRAGSLQTKEIGKRQLKRAKLKRPGARGYQPRLPQP